MCYNFRMSNIDLETLRIPAFQRKRSIQGRANKKLILTAYDRKEAGIPIVERVKKMRRPVVKKEASTFTPPMIFGEPMSDSDLETVSHVPVIESVESLPNFREMKECGICEGYLEKIAVAIVGLNKTLRVGDRILFETSDGLFEQVVESMQINRKDVKIARTGSDIGMKVFAEPKKNGKVYVVKS